MPAVKLHIVSFDIPYPPDYGGIIDVFYKIKNLAEAGVQIILHCSSYNKKPPAAILEQLCKTVHYYPRHTGLSGISATKPYMVYSRRNERLLSNLIKTEAPILFDGLSTSYYLHHPALASRLKILRPQNVEQDYYRLLAEREKNFFKKSYYRIESKLIQSYENQLQPVDAFFTVAKHDHDFFKEKYPEADHLYIPSFQPSQQVIGKAGMGKYCLYHANFSVAENEEAALFLIKKIIPYSKHDFMLAGKNPSPALINAVKQIPNCTIISNPSQERMEHIISEAHIHVLLTFQNTGLKLKLLQSLFLGRHVLANHDMVYGTGLEKLCHIAATASAFIQAIDALMHTPFTDNDIQRRADILSVHYNNQKNAGQIITYLQR